MPRSILRPGVFAAGGFSHLVNAKQFGLRWERVVRVESSAAGGGGGSGSMAGQN